MTANGQPILVLKSIDEARAARRWLRARRLDLRGRPVTWVLAQAQYALRTRHRLSLSYIKGWDVAHFAQALMTSLPQSAYILDIGGVSSELPWVLHLAGFKNLIVCDLDPAVLSMPFNNAIHYCVGDFGSLGIRPQSLDAVTAVSTIEHGMDLPRFFATASGLLRSGGWLNISTDYWPDKINTNGVRAFGLPWTIFSASEVNDLIETAEEAGFTLGHGWLVPDAMEAPVKWNNRCYTFIAMLFQKC